MPEPSTGPQPADEPNSLNELGKEMAPTDAGSSQGEPGSLPYESPLDRAKREPPLNVLGMTFACAIGFAVAAAAVLFFSAFVFMGMSSNFDHSSTTDHSPMRYTAAVYILLFAGTMYGVFRLSHMPGWRQVGRWWALGLLLGTGAGLLLEGICFAATGN
ncbi:MAG: hypothetical protein JWP03_5503 [Phycisphaerales bacterium]|jgi:hypothetical protein|nr:hypothetical protein [Phycisphaerales bacterium]